MLVPATLLRKVFQTVEMFVGVECPAFGNCVVLQVVDDLRADGDFKEVPAGECNQADANQCSR